MSLITCRQCGTEFDPDRAPVIPGANTMRCSSCGADHSDQEPVPEAPATVEKPAPADALPVEQLADSDGDVHLHVHYHE